MVSPRRLLVLLLVAWIAFGFPGHSLAFGQSSSAPELTNDDVIRMVKAGLDEDIIIDKIADSAAKFDTTTDALIKLKEASVPDRVIRAMIGAGSHAVKASEAAGLFLKEGERLVRLEPTTAQWKPGFAKGIFYLRGAHARARTNQAQPRFSFSFADAVGQLAFAGPDEFLLVRLEEKADSREVSYGGKGLASKAIPLKLTQVGDRTYDVTTERVVGPGEYAFFHQQTGRAFDFAVTTGP